jgi:hypothetical protein
MLTNSDLLDIVQSGAQFGKSDKLSGIQFSIQSESGDYVGTESGAFLKNILVTSLVADQAAYPDPSGSRSGSYPSVYPSPFSGGKSGQENFITRSFESLRGSGNAPQLLMFGRFGQPAGQVTRAPRPISEGLSLHPDSFEYRSQAGL